MPRNRKETESALLGKGFQPRPGDHNYFIYWSLDGKKTIAKTKTSHSGKDITDDLLAQMARQCKLTKPLLLQLIDCPMKREDYEGHLQKLGWL